MAVRHTQANGRHLQTSQRRPWSQARCPGMGCRWALGNCSGIPQIKLMPSGNEAGLPLPR